MAFLGINGTSVALWLAVVSDEGEIVEAQTSMAISEQVDLDEQIATAVDEATRLFDTHHIESVAILDAETSGKFHSSFVQLVPRISIEAAVMLAARRSDVHVKRWSRASVRSALSLPKAGALTSHVSQVLATHAPHWSNKRDLAALVAMADRNR